MVEVEYIGDQEREVIDFHPLYEEQEISYWKTLQARPQSLQIDIDEKKEKKTSDEKQCIVCDDERCIICDVAFSEFGYKTIVPCTHSGVCAKCALRMRWFEDLTKQNNKSVPLCPFCKV